MFYYSYYEKILLGLLFFDLNDVKFTEKKHNYNLILFPIF
jgi:hypothetical protein